MPIACQSTNLSDLNAQNTHLTSSQHRQLHRPSHSNKLTFSTFSLSLSRLQCHQLAPSFRFSAFNFNVPSSSRTLGDALFTRACSAALGLSARRMGTRMIHRPGGCLGCRRGRSIRRKGGRMCGFMGFGGRVCLAWWGIFISRILREFRLFVSPFFFWQEGLRGYIGCERECLRDGLQNPDSKPKAPQLAYKSSPYTPPQSNPLTPSSPTQNPNLGARRSPSTP